MNYYIYIQYILNIHIIYIGTSVQYIILSGVVIFLLKNLTVFYLGICTFF